METPNLLISPQQSTPQRIIIGVEGSVSVIHRHLQCEQYHEACKAARDLLASSPDPLQLSFLTTSFQQTIAAVLPCLDGHSAASTKTASALLEMLVTLAAYNQDGSFLGTIFSFEQNDPCPSLLLQQVRRVVGCSVNILDSAHQQIQKYETSSIDNPCRPLGFDIIDACQVRVIRPFVTINAGN
jgi:hypothetical protein